MADTLGTGTLTQTVTITLPIGSETYNFSKVTTIASVQAPMDRRITVPFASEIQVFSFLNAAAVDGLGGLSSFDKVAIINDDDTNFVRLRINVSGADTFDYQLDPGEVFLLGSQNMEVNTTEAAFGAFVIIDEIHAQADTAAVTLRAIAYRV